MVYRFIVASLSPVSRTCSLVLDRIRARATDLQSLRLKLRYVDLFTPPPCVDDNIPLRNRSQIDYMMQMLAPVLRGEASSFEVLAPASEKWNSQIQARLAGSVWSYCSSWYRLGHTSKNLVIWPGTLAEMWWSLKSPIWADYKAIGAQKWERKRRMRWLWKGLKSLALGSLLCGALLMWRRELDAQKLLHIVKSLV